MLPRIQPVVRVKTPLRVVRPRPLLTAALAGCVLGCGDGGGSGGDANTSGTSTVADAGGAPDGGCAPDETESPNGLCVKNIPCGADIPTFKLGLEADGEQGRYTAKIVDAMPAPPKQYRNAWVLDFLDAVGEPASDLVIDKVRPWMPSHAHDGRIVPKVEAAEAPGSFSVTDINMWMPGPWEVQLTVNGSAGDDYVVFRVCVLSLK